MSNGDRAKPRFFIGALASIVAAVEGAILLARKYAQATTTTIVGLPSEFVNLVSSIAIGVGGTIERLEDIIDAIKNIQLGDGTILVFPPNNDGIFSQFVQCPTVQPAAYQLPNLDIPRGRAITLLARQPIGVNTGIIYVSSTQPLAGTIQQAYPLPPNATISFSVKNANSIWIGATVAGEGVYITVEQDK